MLKLCQAFFKKIYSVPTNLNRGHTWVKVERKCLSQVTPTYEVTWDTFL